MRGDFQAPRPFFDLRPFLVLYAFPAFRSAIAIACFCGFPSCISVLMFSEMTLRDDPDRSGMASPIYRKKGARDRVPPIRSRLLLASPFARPARWPHFAADV